jgi:hypothetical protein
MVAADYEFDDEAESVTYTPLTGDPATVAAKRTELSHREASLGGPAGIQPTDVVWIVFAATITAIPVRSATITDSDSDVWTVQSVTTRSFAGTPYEYRCICRKRAT